MENAEELDLLHKRMEFSGCKIALICDDKLLTILRDDISIIPWPNMWGCRAVAARERKRPLNVSKEKF